MNNHAKNYTVARLITLPLAGCLVAVATMLGWARGGEGRRVAEPYDDGSAD